MKLASLLKPIGNLRLIRVALMLAIAILTSGGSLFAADFSVELGVDSRAGRDAGTVECEFDKNCRLKLEPLGLAVEVYVSNGDRNRLRIRMVSDEPGCCFFDGAAPSIVMSLPDALSPFPIFRGQRARGALFIENERVGTLYFRFQRR